MSALVLGSLHPPHCFMVVLEVMSHSVVFMQVAGCWGMAQDHERQL